MGEADVAVPVFICKTSDFKKLRRCDAPDRYNKSDVVEMWLFL